MFTDAAEIDQGAVLEADVCIVGAGAAGITLATELSGRGLQTILLESGGRQLEEATQALYEGQYLADEFANAFGLGVIPMDDIRLRYLGGTTGHWAGYCRPIQPVAFDERPWLPGAAWPLTRQQLDPYYARAAEIAWLGPYEPDWQYWNDEYGIGTPMLDDEVVASTVFQINFPMPFGSAYRDALNDADDVQVVLHANATRVAATAPDATHVDGIEVATLDGGTFSVQARAYVVATGGIESARLLLASDDVNPAGVGNENDLVGRNFCEHLVLPAGFATVTPTVDDLSLYGTTELPVSPDPDRTIGLRGCLIPTAATVRAEEMLDWEVQLELGTLPEGAPAQTEGARTTDVVPLLDQVEGVPGRSVMYVQVTGEQIPRPDNQVVLSDELDALGQRRADLRWTVAPEERASMVRALDLVSQQLGSLGLGRLQVAPGGMGYNPEPPEGGDKTTLYQVDPAAIDLESFPVGVGFHHMGTLRMATDPTQGVVDADCRVHTVDNLYVAGSSVFPSSGASTPTLTIVALAVRLAEHLRTQVLA